MISTVAFGGGEGARLRPSREVDAFSHVTHAYFTHAFFLTEPSRVQSIKMVGLRPKTVLSPPYVNHAVRP